MDTEKWKQNLQDKMESVLLDIPLKHANYRKAYVSGVYFALIIAMAYVESEKPVVDHAFWSDLMKIKEETLSVRELVDSVKRNSYGKIVITENMIPQPGLRYGSPGEYYRMGVRTGIGEVIMIIIPFLYKIYNEDAYKVFMSWVDSEMNRLISM